MEVMEEKEEVEEKLIVESDRWTYVIGGNVAFVAERREKWNRNIEGSAGIPVPVHSQVFW